MSLAIAHSRLSCWFMAAILGGPLWAASAVRSEAALTPILDSPATWGEPNLIGTNPFSPSQNPSVLETLYGESNLRRIDDSTDIYFAHIGYLATFKAVAAFTSDLSEFGYFPNGSTTFVPLFRIPGSSDGYSPAMVALPIGFPSPEFISSAGIHIDESGPGVTLGLINLTRGLYFGSDPAINLGESAGDRMVTFQITNNVGHPDNVIGNLIVAWESGRVCCGDRDFQDLVLEISGLQFVPEPASWMLAVFAGLPAILRKRTRRK